MRFEQLLVAEALYSSIDVDIDDLTEMDQLLLDSRKYNIDCFCVQCNEKRIFEKCRKRDIYGPPSGPVCKEYEFMQYINEQYSLKFQCTRNSDHLLYFNLLVTENKMIKIGQYPSFADLSTQGKGKYKYVLKDNYSEYQKSLGLASHGVGIGSFVYLRRILENLVLSKYAEVSGSLAISIDEFRTKGFIEKIDVIKDYLPGALVKNKNIYAIISKGIHELDEKECLEMFPYVKLGIELILDDALAEKEKKEKEKQLSQYVGSKTGELRKRADAKLS